MYYLERWSERGIEVNNFFDSAALLLFHPSHPWENQDSLSRVGGVIRGLELICSFSKKKREEKQSSWRDKLSNLSDDDWYDLLENRGVEREWIQALSAQESQQIISPNHSKRMKESCDWPLAEQLSCAPPMRAVEEFIVSYLAENPEKFGSRVFRTLSPRMLRAVLTRGDREELMKAVVQAYCNGRVVEDDVVDMLVNGGLEFSDVVKHLNESEDERSPRLLIEAAIRQYKILVRECDQSLRNQDQCARTEKLLDSISADQLQGVKFREIDGLSGLQELRQKRGFFSDARALSPFDRAMISHLTQENVEWVSLLGSLDVSSIRGSYMRIILGDPDLRRAFLSSIVPSSIWRGVHTDVSIRISAMAEAVRSSILGSSASLESSSPQVGDPRWVVWDRWTLLDLLFVVANSSREDLSVDRATFIQEIISEIKKADPVDQANALAHAFTPWVPRAPGWERKPVYFHFEAYSTTDWAVKCDKKRDLSELFAKLGKDFSCEFSQLFNRETLLRTLLFGCCNFSWKISEYGDLVLSDHEISCADLFFENVTEEAFESLLEKAGEISLSPDELSVYLSDSRFDFLGVMRKSFAVDQVYYLLAWRKEAGRRTCKGAAIFRRLFDKKRYPNAIEVD